VSDWFFQNRFAPAELGDNGIEFPAIVRHSAIGYVIPIPTRGRVQGIEIGQVDWGDAARNSIHQQPSTSLPVPTWGRARLFRQVVVKSEGATHRQKPIGYVVRRTDGVLLKPTVDVQLAHTEIEGAAYVQANIPFDRNGFAEGSQVCFGCGISRDSISGGQQEKERNGGNRSHAISLGTSTRTLQDQATQPSLEVPKWEKQAVLVSPMVEVTKAAPQDRPLTCHRISARRTLCSKR